MPVALAQIRDLLLPGLWGISGKYEQIERQWPKIFTRTDSKMALERRASMRYLGLAQLKQEGGVTAFDNASGERYVMWPIIRASAKPTSGPCGLS